LDEGITPAPVPAVDPAPARRPFVTVWEDKVAFASTAIIILGAMLPWYRGQPLLVAPTREALVAAGLGVLAVALLLWVRGAQNTRLRRQLCLLLGGGTLLAAGYVAIVYVQYHAGIAPKEGIIGHLAYLGIGLDLTILGGMLLVWSGVPSPAPAPPVPAASPDPEERMPRWQRIAVPLMVFVAAFAFYHTDVEKPSIVDFDEAHYVRVALNITDGVLIDPAWAEPRPFNFEHPPVGKYFIALGYWLYGEPHDEYTWPQYHQGCDERECPPELKHDGCRVDCREDQVYKGCNTDNPQCRRDAASWRFGSVLVGSLGVLGIYWLGLRLFRNVAGGLLSAGLLLTENLYYLHARTAMLDIFAVGLLLLGLGVFLGPTRWHRWAGSAIYGFAVASKHYALFLLPVLLLFAVLRAPRPDRLWRLRDALLFGLLVPFAAYTLTYLPYMWIWATSSGRVVDAYHWFVYMHQEGFRWTYRAELDKPHPYFSRPWTWVPMKRPVFYFVGYDSVGNVGHIYAIGNPFLWWSASVAVLYAFFTRTSDWVVRQFAWDPRSYWTVFASLVAPPVLLVLFDAFRRVLASGVDGLEDRLKRLADEVPNAISGLLADSDSFLLWGAGTFAFLALAFSLKWVRSPRMRESRVGPRAFWEWTDRPLPLHRDLAVFIAALLFLFAYGPFFLLKREPFNFYFLNASPFYALAAAGFLVYAWTRGAPGRLLVILYVTLSALAFAFFHPVVAGTYITEQDFQYIMHRIPGMQQ
jgi:dolichyl-phosphate-mannose--protein O-mannosyl transferase